MSKKKHKNDGKENKKLETIVFITAIISLLQAIIDIVKSIIE